MYNLHNKLVKERYKRGEDEKEVVISYWTTPRNREDNGIWKRKN